MDASDYHGCVDGQNPRFSSQRHQVCEQLLHKTQNKKPLFILLDGSWREAKKMFRKSPYLNNLPVLSINPQLLINSDYVSKYQIRNSSKDNQLATAEVAAQVLAIADEVENGRILDCWFEVYSYQYQKGVCQTNKGDPLAQTRFENLTANLR